MEGNREASAPLVPAEAPNAQPMPPGMMQPQNQAYIQPQAQPYVGVPVMQQGYPAPQQGYQGPQAVYPGPQAGYQGQPVMQPGYPAPPVAVWTSTTQVTTCRFCNTTGPTQVRYEPGAVTWLSCLGICLLGGGLGCCLIPFCVEPLQDCIHTCPRCGQMLGRKALV